MRLPYLAIGFFVFDKYFNMSCSVRAFSFCHGYGLANSVASLRILKWVPARRFSKSLSLPYAGSNHALTSLRGSNEKQIDGAKSYQLDGVGVTGGTRVEATTNTGHSIATDIPKSMGGKDTAPQPVETLLGAWMGCTQATASFVGRQLLRERAQTHKISNAEESSDRSRKRRPSRTEVLLQFDNIRAFRDEAGALELPICQTPSVPSRLQRITGTIKVSVVPATGGEEALAPMSLDPRELEILKEQTEARCPIANMMVASGCAMEVEWKQER